MAIQQLQLDVTAFPESNLSSRGQTKEVLETQLSGNGESVRLVQASARSDIAVSEYQPGGVVTAIVGKIAGRVLESYRDPWGRFAWTRFRGDRGEGIQQITAYRVCQKVGTKAGVNTSYSYQVQQMLQEELERSQQFQRDERTIPESNRSRMNPRRRILDDLERVIQEAREKKFRVILMMDANEDWTKKDGKELKAFMDKVQLRDPLYERHYSDEVTPTYARGTKRIDYILMDASLMGAVRRIGTLGLHQAMISDHVMVYVDLDEREAFEGQLNRPVRIPSREFILAQSDKCEKFMEVFLEQAERHQFKRRIERLSEKFKSGGAIKELVTEYNNLDKQIQDSMLHAAKKTIKKKFGYNRSMALGTAGYAVNFWKSVLSAKMLHVTIPAATRRMAEKLKLDMGYVTEMSTGQTRKRTRETVEEL